ncbi:MAG: asparaginase [Nocardioidaceae bacterium]
MRQISLLATGGTISTGAGPSGAVPVHGSEDLITGLDCPPGITVRPRDVSKVSSRAFSPTDMWTLAEAVRAEIRDGADGVVVTHGTDIIEETAYALALLVDTSVPVVLTGAMRPPHAAGPDGPANLLAALTAAADESLAAYGPVVVMHDEIHSAHWVTKVHSTRMSAFQSPAAGPLGVLVEGRVELYAGPPAQPDRLSITAAPSARVELLWAVAGADGFLVDAIADGVDGLVVAGTGGGHLPPAMAEATVRLARERPVVLCSRCAGNGQVLQQTYGGVGSETHLLSEGIVAAGSLAPPKARLRLLFGLSAGHAVHELFRAGHTP